MTNEEEVQGSERMRPADRATALRADVIPLLRQLAPTAPEPALEAACSEVASAIMSYELSSQMTKAETLQEQRRDLLQPLRGLAADFTDGAQDAADGRECLAAFAHVGRQAATALADAGLLFYGMGDGVVRFVTSFQTTDDDIAEVLRRAAAVLG